MNASGPARARDERGFVLMGVVMFMLALTILGLSLFALSSYEAQFFFSSVSREQALQSSESGMEVVKALLSERGNLEAAQFAVGRYGITRALAYQQLSSDPRDTTSRGLVNWDNPVVIVVSAKSGGEERAVKSSFQPSAAKNPYEQLVTCGGNLWYNAHNGDATVEFTGPVWQRVGSAADTAWTAHVGWPSGRPLDPSPPPMPLADAFVSGHLPADDPTDYNLGGAAFIEFDNHSHGPAFYHSPPPPASGHAPAEQAWYEFVTDQDMTLKIRGTVVWVVGQGACFRRALNVEALGANDPANPNVLVIVARPNVGDPANGNRGLWMQGSLHVSDSRVAGVFLVSQGDISLTQYDDPSSSFDALAVSIVAGGDVELMGPTAGNLLRLQHPATMDTIADQLLANGALPTPSGGGKAFAFARGSWLETRLP